MLDTPIMPYRYDARELGRSEKLPRHFEACWICSVTATQQFGCLAYSRVIVVNDVPSPSGRCEFAQPPCS